MRNEIGLRCFGIGTILCETCRLKKIKTKGKLKFPYFKTILTFLVVAL